MPVKSWLGNSVSVKSRLGTRDSNRCQTEEPLKSRENLTSNTLESISAKKLVKEEDGNGECSNNADWASKIDNEEKRRRQVKGDLQK